MRFPSILSAVLLFGAGAAEAQIIQVVSGNGQVASQLAFSNTPKTSFDNLVVRVVDVAGRPLPNTTVTWAVITGSGSLDASTTTTDAAGQSSNRFAATFDFINVSGAPYSQSVISATAVASSVQFTLTQELINRQAPSSAQLTLGVPSPGNIAGQSGSVSATPFPVTVFTVGGLPVPGVAVSLATDDDPALGLPTVTCQTQAGQAPGVVLTDATGTANCQLVFGPKIGPSATFKVNAGGGWRFSSSIPFSVTVGPPALIKGIRGDNQTAGAPDTLLPTGLVAEVDDLGGNPAGPNIPVTWTIDPPGSAELQGAGTVTSIEGQVAVSRVRIITGAGFRVRVALVQNPNINYTFTVNGPAVTISGLNKLSGDGQDAAQNTAFTNPLSVQAIAAGQPAAGAPVSFRVISGSATLSSSGGTTNAQGTASVNLTAGPTVGPVVVTATSGSFTVTFNLTVRPPGPAFSSDSFYNGFSYLKASDPNGGISPCSVARIVAAGITGGIQGFVGPTNFGPLPYIINNVTVTFGTQQRAPLFGLSNQNGVEEIVFQVPCDVTPGEQQVTVSVSGSAKTGTVSVRAVSPGILEYNDPSDQRVRAVIVRPDGSFVNAEGNPARKGELVRAYVTGLGPTVPIMSTNSVAVPGVTDSVPTGSVIVGVNNSGARLVGVRAAPNLIGTLEVTFEISGETPANNNLPFSIAVNPAGGGSTVFSKGSVIPVL